MKLHDRPTSPKEVQLTEENEVTLTKTKHGSQKQLVANVEITFCTHVGWDGMLVMMLSLAIAGLFVYITSLYTKGFQVWNRHGVWVFMIFALLYVLLVMKFLCGWRKLATSFTEQQQAGREKNQDVSQLSRDARNDVKRMAINARVTYNKFQINGQWFLWKLYAFELVESLAYWSFPFLK